MAMARRIADWRGSRALDGALVVLAIALTLGANLLPGDDLDPFAAPLPGLLLALLFAVHALPLGWRTDASRRGLAVTLAAVLIWLCLDLAGWPEPPVSDMFLWCCWMELALLYAMRVHDPDWPAPVVAAGVGGLALVSGDGITGDRPAAWLVLTAVLAYRLWRPGVWGGSSRRAADGTGRRSRGSGTYLSAWRPGRRRPSGGESSAGCVVRHVGTRSGWSTEPRRGGWKSCSPKPEPG